MLGYMTIEDILITSLVFNVGEGPGQLPEQGE